jgi:hypothetical protein
MPTHKRKLKSRKTLKYKQCGGWTFDFNIQMIDTGATVGTYKYNTNKNGTLLEIYNFQSTYLSGKNISIFDVYFQVPKLTGDLQDGVFFSDMVLNREKIYLFHSFRFEKDESLPKGFRCLFDEKGIIEGNLNSKISCVRPDGDMKTSIQINTRHFSDTPIGLVIQTIMSNDYSSNLIRYHKEMILHFIHLGADINSPVYSDDVTNALDSVVKDLSISLRKKNTIQTNRDRRDISLYIPFLRFLEENGARTSIYYRPIREEIDRFLR